MKMYICHARNYNFQDELYRPIKESSFFKEHEIILPHESAEIKESKKTIASCDLVIAEVSFPSTGCGIELGWANMQHIPIVAFHKQTTRPSNSVRAVTQDIQSYTDSHDLIKKITSAIEGLEK